MYVKANLQVVSADILIPATRQVRILALPGGRWPSYRCVMSLTPPSDRPCVDDIGSRMTVRMHDPEGGFRDILGILESPSTIRKRDGSVVSFDPDRVAIWRKIPPRREHAGKGSPLSLRIIEMERIASATWPAAEQVPLGDWILRASGKFTMRANSVLTLGEPGIEIEAAIEKVVAFYEERDLVPTFQIILPLQVNLDALLESKGWQEKMIVHVMVADIAIGELSDSQTGTWELSSSPSDEWIAFQQDEDVRDILERFPAIYAELRIDNQLVAAGRAAVCEDWTVLTRLLVRSDFRSRGLGRELVTRLLNESIHQGATKSLLQVDSKNTVAIALYRRMGFSLHHAYKYRYMQSAETPSQC